MTQTAVAAASSGRNALELGDVTPHNVRQLRVLNAAIFPVAYQEAFYQSAPTLGEFAKLAYFNDIMVGAVCCRIEPEQKRLYIMTLGCLAPYRRLGLGALMLQHVLKECDHHLNTVESVYLHVQVGNEDALAFYKKFGFVVTETLDQYYKRIEPAGAHVLVKRLC
ncbi:Nat13 protein [Capsaspora owczarzaki ATCC 30864]|uniref:Nat13 protein n=1 Tax=Capsaspora owczarzaki (strain ATCC 30864) TaxID=595528 RepID=A0A0D2VUW3_CAPO3|nr:Nat13 protein [Capsaspora owczarzaki ATCC 30864]KJE95177.1 Nat13 protein [Capsaspora owczarzaki ATCC 30864]|eukprot:XP_004346328.1 Nat13 protein [Capsaspora owczarzaki ATCC 30864]